MSNVTEPTPNRPTGRRSATYFFLRGLSIALPPVLTLLILLWVANGFNEYVVQPVNMVVRFTLATLNNDIRTEQQLAPPPPGFPVLPDWGRNYLVSPVTAAGQVEARPIELTDDLKRLIYVPMARGTDPGKFVPLADYELVFRDLRPVPAPTTAIGLYMEIAGVRDYRRQSLLSVLSLLLVVIAMYFLGRFVTARIGTWVVRKLESLLTRVPLVRNVYSTVKQVTDFVLNEREVEFQRVVAIEYPRAGAWTLGFVTGEGMLDCVAEVREPMITVLVPTSPIPAGGFTVMVPRRSVIDLNLTIDQAVQFVVSCGVLIPPQQRASGSLAAEPEHRGSSPPLAGATAET